MPFANMGICLRCRSMRYLALGGLCERCLKDAMREEAAADAEELRRHPDLEEFEEYADRWYR